MKKRNNIRNIFTIMLVLALIASMIFIKNINNITKSMNTNKKDANAGNSIDTSRGTIVNIPLDSRPITRNNFQYLVKAAGYNYVEISDGLDSMGTDEVWKIGNPTKVRESISSAFSYGNYNNQDTTVIINASSYFFGGVVATSDYKAYRKYVK